MSTKENRKLADNYWRRSGFKRTVRIYPSLNLYAYAISQAMKLAYLAGIQAAKDYDIHRRPAFDGWGEG